VQLSNRPTPYTIGYTLFRRIKGERGFDAALAVRAYYEDIRLIDEGLTEEMVQRLDIFVYDPKDRLKNYDLQLVKEMLINQKLYKGEPYVEVEPGTHHRDLVLVHRDDERKLDPKRVGLFLKAVHSLWRNPVRLRANNKVYSFDRRGLSTS
jgi:stage V sporulation protein R